MAQGVHFHQSALQDMLRDYFKKMKKKSEREAQVQRVKMAMNKYLSIITLNVNGLNAPIKRHRVAE